ncbi:MAG: hypothetical protein LQ339_006713 [Xanthoria mediterranea]|nr:MAG: hypothetical protein LQ339_006713 [Xanthoria mediterranea]
MMLSLWVLPLLARKLSMVNATPVVPPAPAPAPLNAPAQGNVLEFEDSVSVPNDYQICSERGNDYWNTLGTTLLNPNAQDKTDGFLPFQQFYMVELQGTESAELAYELEADGVDADSMDLWITSDKLPRQEWEDRPYHNYFNTRDGVIIAEMNFRISDRVQKLHWSELMYQTWLQAAGWADAAAVYNPKGHIKGGPLSTLKTVIQSTVVNTQTQAILRLMYTNQGLEAEGDRPEDRAWVKWTEVKVPAFWDALMGTDNVRGTVYLLNDHSLEVGRKIITEVWTKWVTFAPDIWLVFSTPFLDFGRD